MVFYKQILLKCVIIGDAETDTDTGTDTIHHPHNANAVVMRGHARLSRYLPLTRQCQKMHNLKFK